MQNFMNYNFDIESIALACYVGAGSGTPVHKNRPSHGIVFHTGGVREYTFDENNTITVLENDILYLPKGANYTVKTQGEGGCYAINFQFFSSPSFEPFKFKIKNHKGFGDLFRNAEQVWRKKSLGFEVKCKSLLYNILYELIKEYEIGYIPSTKTRLIKPAIDYIFTEYTNDNIEVSCLAKLCNMSESYFRRIFLKNYGISPIKYINKLKVERAKELLVSGLYTVSEVAELSGFHDESYFSREFKKHFNIAPSEYRKASRQ